MRCYFLALLIFLATCFLFSNKIKAQSSKDIKDIQGKHFENWQSACETLPNNQQICHISQRLISEENEQDVFSVTVGFPPSQDNPTIIFTLPLGVKLQPGIRVQIDEREPFDLAYDQCKQIGCLAGVALDKKIVEMLKDGTKMKIAFIRSDDQTSIVSVSLSGFASGLAAIAP